MNAGKPSEFFLTGLGTACPLMLWAGSYELAAILFVFLVGALIACEEDGDDADSDGGTGGGTREPRLVGIRHEDPRDR